MTAIRTFGHFFLASLLLVPFIESSTARSDSSHNVQVIVVRNERISGSEIQLQVRITNRSERPVFMTGIIYEDGPRLYPVYLEQLRPPEGWKIVVPCVDTDPPHVIKLEPGKSMTEDFFLKLPLEGVCKVQYIKLEGKFRFRLNYFGTEERARAHLEKFGSWGWENAQEGEALSEPFEIPPYRPPGPA